jgi:histidinol-phosphate aminotransferase
MNTAFNWDSFIPPRIKANRPYVPGEQKNTRDWIKLNTNEFPFPPSPTVADAVQAACANLRLYPDPTGRALREGLADLHQVSPDSIVLFNGCDDALNCCIRGIIDPGEKVGFLNPSYSLYNVLLQNQGAVQQPIEYKKGFELPLEELCTSDAKMLILTTPNAPSGRPFERAQFEKLLQDPKPRVIVADETYADYASWSLVSLVKDYPHLIVTRSFSKTYGLAGMRVGYTIASPEANRILHQIRDVYNVNRLSQAAALAAIQDRAYYAGKHALIAQTRGDFASFVTTGLGWQCLPSATNFLFILPTDAKGEASPEFAQKLQAFLVEHRVLIRYFPNHPLTSAGLRVSIGTPEEMKTLKELLASWKTHAP